MSFDKRSVVTERAISENGLRRFSRATLPANSVCVVCIGATIGKICMTEVTTLTNQQLNSIVCDTNVADPHFVYYSLRLKRDELVAKAAGAATPILNKSAFEQIKIRLPPLHVQHRVGGILSAYDDLIEVNTHRIAILEEMARRLFGEQITQNVGRLPFPSDRLDEWHLPNGWRFERLTDVATIVMGQSPPSHTYNSEGRGLPFHQGVTDFEGSFHGNRLFADDVDRPRIAEAGDILFSVRAPVARIAVALDKMILGRGLAAIRPHPGRKAFVLCHLRATFPRPDMIGDGAIYKAVNKDDVHSIPIVWPGSHLTKRLERHFEADWSQIKILYLSNQKLRASRDLLLPKLISGEIDLERAERGVKAIAERAAAE